ncbi:MAG: hypothetical protein HRT35_25365 [Algicola sp.]|nr:hypothetical protein [Algicola sp.]
MDSLDFLFNNSATFMVDFIGVADNDWRLFSMSFLGLFENSDRKALPFIEQYIWYIFGDIAVVSALRLIIYGVEIKRLDGENTQEDELAMA